MTQSDTPLAAVSTTGQQRIAALEAEVARLRSALMWYADSDNHYAYPDERSAVDQDYGDRARDALGIED